MLNIIRSNIFIISINAVFHIFIFISNSYVKNVTIEVKRASKLPIHAYENKSSLANIVAIVGGNGLKNKRGKSRNFLVSTKENFQKKYMNFYLFPN